MAFPFESLTEAGNSTMTLDGGAGLIAILMAMIGIVIVISIALYIYMGFVWMTLAKKMGREDIAWLAWVPLASMALMPILADKDWPWVFMMLVPVANIVFMIMWMWKIFEKRKYPGALALLPLGMIIPVVKWFVAIGYLIVMGVVAWNDRN